MNVIVFNASLLIAWLLMSAGAWLIGGIGAGLFCAGVTLVVLCCLACRVAGGLYDTGMPGGGP